MGLTRQLKETKPFNHLPEEILEEFCKAAVLKKFPPHTHIFNQHDPPTGYLYILKEGLVEIVALTPGGVEMVVAYRKKGSFFGGTPVFTNEPYTAGARTLNPTECYLIPQNLVAKAAKQYPQIYEHLSRAIFSQVRSLYMKMVGEHAKNALAQMEAYPFQKRLSSIMSSPVETCPPATPVKEVAQRMAQKGIGAMVVCDETNCPAGIVTERDLVAKVLAREAGEGPLPTASDVMTPNPFTMTPDTYMYEAISFMMGHRIRHLPVLDNGDIVGIVTVQDLMRYRSQKSMLLVGRVKEAQTIDDLVTAKAEMVKVAKALMCESRSIFETMEILSYIHHRILSRCFEIVLQLMAQQGMTPPDIRFCLVIMGSGGRKEMLLGPDQDNGIIYEDFPDSMLEEVEAFFIPFNDKLVEAYARIGYPLCKGGVMANNPFWRGRLKDWRARVSDWIWVPEPKKVMHTNIFLDFMPLFGAPSLCQDLRHFVQGEVRKNPKFLYHLLENDLQNKPPIGLLGRFIVERGNEHKGKLSLKKAGSIFIVDCIRIFFLEKGIGATTTAERLNELVKLGVFSQETAEHLKAALEAFTFLRLRNEIALIDQGKEPSHYIDPYALNKNEQDLLREAFRAAGKLQVSTERHFGQVGLYF